MLKKIKFDKKMMTFFFIVAAVTIVVGGMFSYISAKQSLLLRVTDRLTYQVNGLKRTFEVQMAEIPGEKARALKLVERTILQQVKMVNSFIKTYNLTAREEKLKELLRDIKIGTSGYAYILDYDGVYVLGYNRESDKKNVFELQDVNGKLVAQEIISKGRSLAVDSFETISYFWKNSNETIAREKLAVIFHIPAKKWIVGISAYYDDLIDFNTQKKSFETFKKKISSEIVGKNGYAYVMSSQGDLISHPNLEGQNIYHHPFVAQICKEKEGTIIYEFEGKNKIAAYAYLPSYDYIVVLTSDISDFNQEMMDMLLSSIKFTIIIMGIFLIVSFYLKILYWFWYH